MILRERPIKCNDYNARCFEDRYRFLKNKIIDNINSVNDIVLPRRSGKTTIALRLLKDIPDACLIVKYHNIDYHYSDRIFIYSNTRYLRGISYRHYILDELSFDEKQEVVCSHNGGYTWLHT